LSNCCPGSSCAALASHPEPETTGLVYGPQDFSTGNIINDTNPLTMKEILGTLDTRKRQLQQSSLCQFLGDTSVPHYSRLSFTPSMLFFTMGFKDILFQLQDENNPSPLQQSVNIHCEEDSFHWEWYLKDLERISYGKDFLNLPRAEAFSRTWSDAHRPVRDVVYESIHLAKTYTSPFHRLIIIEALEATFDCFNEPVFKLVQEMGKQDELEYFGQTHAHSEASHAMEKTTEDHESTAYQNYKPVKEEEAIAVHIINKVFDAFEDVFAFWHSRAMESNGIAATA
jgi:hypothetical protein